MKRYLIFFLRFVIFIAGGMAVILCAVAAWLAVMESNPASEYHYLSYIFLFGTCCATAPYFAALYQAYKILRYIDCGCAFTKLSSDALKIISRCAFAIFVICTLGGLPFFYAVAQIEDAPGLIVIGVAISCAAITISAFACVLDGLLREAIQFRMQGDATA